MTDPHPTTPPGNREETAELEAALLASEARFRGLFQNMPQGFALHEIVVDAQGKPVDYIFLEVNSSFEELTTLRSEDILGKRVTEVLPDIREDPANWIGLYGDIALNGGSKQFEMYSEPLQRWYMIAAYQPEPMKFAVIVDDITERKDVTQKLMKSEERLHAIFNSAVDVPIQGFNEKREVIFWNQASENLYGYTREEAMGRRVEELFFPEEEWEEVIQSFPKWIDPMVSNSADEFTVLTKTGEMVQVFCSQVTYVNPQEEVELFSIDIDLTDRNRIEEERLRIQRLEGLGLVAGGIAHDFNNLLTGVFGCMELAKLQLPPGNEAVPILEQGGAALDRAKRLTSKLLTFSKGGNPVLEMVSLRAQLEDVVRFHLSGSNVSAEFDIDPALWSVRADTGQLDQLFANLTVNAKQAMSSGGRLTVRAGNRSNLHEGSSGDRGEFVEVVFQDTGPGIPEEMLNRIFDPYFTTKSDGTGLGLAVTHSIVAKHGGFIRVDSVPGNGACFTVMIPAVPKGVPAMPMVKKDEKVSAVHSGKILVMDDEDMILEVTTRILTKAGYEVEVVKKGEDVLEKLKSTQDSDTPFTAVIMDLTVPGGMGGRETLPLLRKVDKDIPVLVSSGYSSNAIMSDPATHGFDGSVAKPFRAKELLAEMSRVLCQYP